MPKESGKSERELIDTGRDKRFVRDDEGRLDEVDCRFRLAALPCGKPLAFRQQFIPHLWRGFASRTTKGGKAPGSIIWPAGKPEAFRKGGRQSRNRRKTTCNGRWQKPVTPMSIAL